MRATTARQVGHRARGSSRGGRVRLAVVAAALSLLALLAQAPLASAAAVTIAPRDATVPADGSVTLTAALDDPALVPTSIEWSVNGIPVPGANSLQFTLGPLIVPTSHQVSVSITYDPADGSPAAEPLTDSTRVTVSGSAVRIRNAPATVEPGGLYELTATGGLTYEWQDSLAAEFGSPAAATTTWKPTVPGTHVLTVTARDGFGFDSASVNVNVPDRQPVAGFTISGTGLTRTLRSTSSDPDDDELIHAWSVGGGARLSATDTPATRVTFPGPGVYTVRLTVSERNGTLSDKASDTVVIEGAPGQPVTDTPPPAPPPVDLGPRLIEPFPVVRIRGRVFRRATKFDVLSVMAPKGSAIRIRCVGRSCPRRWSAASVRRTRWRRFRGLERRMRAGTVLGIFVMQPGRIGKYTRFKVRALKPPSRRDRCVSAVRLLRVIRCPAG